MFNEEKVKESLTKLKKSDFTQKIKEYYKESVLRPKALEYTRTVATKTEEVRQKIEPITGTEFTNMLITLLGAFIQPISPLTALGIKQAGKPGRIRSAVMSLRERLRADLKTFKRDLQLTVEKARKAAEIVKQQIEDIKGVKEEVERNVYEYSPHKLIELLDPITGGLVNVFTEHIWPRVKYQLQIAWGYFKSSIVFLFNITKTVINWIGDKAYSFVTGYKRKTEFDRAFEKDFILKTVLTVTNSLQLLNSVLTKKNISKALKVGLVGGIIGGGTILLQKRKKTKISQTRDFLSSKISKLREQIITLYRERARKLVDVFKTFVKHFKENLHKIKEHVKSIFRWGWLFFVNFLKSGFELFRNVISSTFGKFAFVLGIGALAFKKGFDIFRNRIMPFTEKVKDVFKRFGSILLKFFRFIARALLTWAAFSKGIQNFIKSGYSWLKDNVRNIWNRLTKVVKKFRTGFLKGIKILKGFGRALLESSKALGAKLGEFLQKTLLKSYEGFKKFFQSKIIEKAKDWWTRIKEKIVNFIKAIVNFGRQFARIVTSKKFWQLAARGAIKKLAAGIFKRIPLAAITGAAAGAGIGSVPLATIATAAATAWTLFDVAMTFKEAYEQASKEMQPTLQTPDMSGTQVRPNENLQNMISAELGLQPIDDNKIPATNRPSLQKLPAQYDFGFHF